MSKEDLKVKPVDQDIANEDLKKINGGTIFACVLEDETEKKGCDSHD